MQAFDSPYTILGPLFVAVQEAELFADSKTFADAIPLLEPASILEKYLTEKDVEAFNLAAFIEEYFDFYAYSEMEDVPSNTPLEHIEKLWTTLTRPAENQGFNYSKLALPHPYIVPGGRFNEIYYWDSYFTMQGLRVAERWHLIESMLDNFAYMVKAFGFIPNGNRTYFLSRSQPPFFSLMVELLAKAKPQGTWEKYGEILEMEYLYWSDKSALQTKHRVEFQPGKYLSRYYDRSNAPRDESYREDVDLVAESTNPNLCAELRSACESGWDFSSRWLQDSANLSTIQISSLLPVDLNCLLWHLEKTLGEVFQSSDASKAKTYSDAADARQTLIVETFFDTSKGFFFDINLDGTFSESLTLAGMFPMFFNLATKEQASQCIETLQTQLFKPGGLVTSSIHSGQQWDAPNGWAPLQYIAVVGLKQYGYHDLAKEIMTRWVRLNESVYQHTGKMMEKYNVEDTTLLAGGGEYPNQDGFGWTNGVYLAFKEMLREL